MKLLLFTFIISTIILPVCATEQMPERLLYNGRVYSFYNFPLNAYFNRNSPKPKDLKACTTGCYRGYVGTWMIKDKSLYLQLLTQPFQTVKNKWEFYSSDYPTQGIFNNQALPIKAQWFNGELKMFSLDQSRSPYSVKFATTIKIKNGCVVSDLPKSEHGHRESNLCWYDLRQVAESNFEDTIVGADLFVTRGIFLAKTEQLPARLWMPATPTSQEKFVTLCPLPTEKKIPDRAYVQVAAQFDNETKESKSLRVEVFDYIHNPSFIFHPDYDPEDSCNNK